MRTATDCSTLELEEVGVGMLLSLLLLFNSVLFCGIMKLLCYSSLFILDDAGSRIFQSKA